MRCSSLLLTLFFCACGTREAAQLGATDSQQQAVVTNGGFETDTAGSAPANWTVANANNTVGVTGTLMMPPASLAALNGATGGTAMTKVVAGTGGNPLTGSDPDLGSAVSFRYPRFGAKAALINYGDSTHVGNKGNINSLNQNVTLDLSDVDPIDGQIHIRFAIAPVLEFSGHPYREQPYYYVQLSNVNNGNILFSRFTSVNDPSMPWNNATGVNDANVTLWQDWSMVDIAPAATVANVGDTVQLSITAAGCAFQTHFGRLYLDGVGNTVPGPFVAATAPRAVVAGGNITYTLNYENGGTSAVNGTAIAFTTPLNANFVSTTGVGCVAPAANTAGTLVCPIGTLGPNSNGNITVTVQSPNTQSQITAANYAISGKNYRALGGPPVTTNLDANARNYTDVQVAVSQPITALSWGATGTYSVTVANAGGNVLKAGTVNVVYPQPTNVATLQWTCSPSSNCFATSGTGSLSEYPALPVNGNVTYTFTATAVSGSGVSTTGSVFQAKVVSNAVDVLQQNNAQAIRFSLGASQPLIVTTNNAGAGKVLSSPAGISCGVACSANFGSGSNVTLSAVPNVGASFTGWSGGGCTGSAPTCIVSMSAAQQVTASFGTAPVAGSPNQILVLAGGTQSAVMSTAFKDPLVALVLDANGTAVSSTNVAFGVPTTGASATVTTPVATNAQGVASTSVTANATTGAYSVTATAGPAFATYALTNTGVATSITYVSGGSTAEPQLVPVSSALSMPLVAILRDNNGNAVPNVSVTFQTQASLNQQGLSASGTAVTDARGYAWFYGVSNATAGAYTVNALVFSGSGIALTANFSVTAIAATPTQILLRRGSNQLAATSQLFATPLSVTVADANGLGLGNQNVTFTPIPVAGATGTLSATTVATDTTGVASVNAMAGTVAGVWMVNAKTTALNQNVTFTLTSDGTHFINVVSGDPQSAQSAQAFSSPLQVKVTDSAGVPVVGTSVAFTAPSSGASATLSANSNTTDPNGVTQVMATASGSLGAYKVTATTSGATDPATFNLTNSAGNPNSLTVGAGVAGQHVQVNNNFVDLSVTAKDISSNPASYALVTFSAPASGASASLSPTDGQVTADVNGVATIHARANTHAGNYNVTVTAGTASATIPLTNQPGSVQIVTAASGTPQQTMKNTNFAQPLVVNCSDTYGNPVSGLTATFTGQNSGNANSIFTSATTAVTDSAGNANAQVKANGAIGGPYTVTGTIGAGSVTFSLSNVAGSPNAVTVTSGGNQNTIVQTAFTNPLVATVADVNGDPVSNQSVTFTSNGTGAGASFANNGTGVTDANGTVSTTLTANTVAGSYTVTIAAGNSNATAGFTNRPSGNTVITASAGNGQSAVVYNKYASSLTVSVVDNHSNPVRGTLVSFVAPTSGPTATLSTPAAITGLDGTASVVAVADKTSGDFNVVAYISGGASTTFTLHATPDVARVLVNDKNAVGLSAQVSTPFTTPLGVTAVDIWGNPVSNATIDFVVPTTSPTATLDHNQAVTDSSGHVAVNATADPNAGAYFVQAHLDGAQTPLTAFQMTNLKGTPVIVAASSGSPASAPVGTAFTAPLVVQVVDILTNPVANKVVNFAPPTSGASVSLSTTHATTDANGIAQVIATANATTGTYTVTGSVVGGTGTALFVLTNAAGDPSDAEPDDVSSPQTTITGAPFGNPLILHVTDAGGNPVSGATVSWQIQSNLGPAPGGTLSSSTSNTDFTGAASVLVTANNTAGDFNVIATVGQLVPAVYNLTNSGTLPPTLSLLTGGNQNTTIGNPFGPITVALLDPNNNPLQNANVTVSLPGKDGLPGLFTPLTSDANGLVQILTDPNINKVVGELKAVVKLPGGLAPIKLPFNVLPGLANLMVVSDAASPQTTLTRTFFANPLTVAIKDSLGNTIPGLAVLLQPPETEPTCTLSSALVSTDLLGLAQVQALAGETVGTYQVKALLQGLNINGGFTLTNASNVPNVISVVQGDQQTTMALTRFANPVNFQVIDSQGFPAAGVGITVSAPVGLTPDSTSLVTDSNGIASTYVTALNKIGAFNLTGTADGGTAPATATLNVTKIPTKTALGAVAAKYNLTAALNANVIVTADAGTPVGKVQLTIDGNVIYEQPVDSSGRMNYVCETPVEGVHKIAANFVPSDPFLASSAAAQTFTVVNNWHAVGNGYGCSAAAPQGLLLLLAAGLGARVLRRRRE